MPEPVDSAIGAFAKALGDGAAYAVTHGGDWEIGKGADRVAKAYGEMQRAYSRLEIKGVSEEERYIKGIASTPTVDRMGDVVEPLGAEFQVPMALLLDHHHSEQVGHVHFAKPTKAGIPFEAKIVKFDEPGEVKDLVDKAWHLVKTKLRSFVSIGFKPLPDGVELLADGGLRFTRWEFLELSLVSIPANREAVILEAKSLDAAMREIKSLDVGLQAEHGQSETDVIRVSGAGKGTRKAPLKPEKQGNSTTIALKERPHMSKTIAEQITALDEKCAANKSRMNAIMAKAMEEDRSTDEGEQNEFDDLARENEKLVGDLKRFKSLDAMNVATAKPVDQVKTADDAAQARGGHAVRVSSPKAAPGIAFARVARCIGLAKGNIEQASRIAERYYQSDQRVVNVLKAAAWSGETSADMVNKAAVDAAGSTTWGAFLVGDETSIFADFAEFLRPMTIVGKFGANGVPGLRNVPFRVPLLSQTNGGDAYWVGEGLGKGLTSFVGARTTLEPLKAANIAVATMELLRDSSPSAEVWLRDQLAAALAARIDTDFIDPTNSGSAGVKPAAITNGVSTIASTGGSADAVRSDIKKVMQPFIDADNPLSSGVWIMSASTALELSLQTTITGAPEFSGMTPRGGTFQGLPVIVSEYVGAYPGSPSARYVWLVNASDIYLGDDGGVEVKMSTEASLQMDSAPTQASIESGSPSGGVATSLVSMFQTNSVAFLAERTINWKLRRASAVQGLHAVQWL